MSWRSFPDELSIFSRWHGERSRTGGSVASCLPPPPPPSPSPNIIFCRQCSKSILGATCWNSRGSLYDPQRQTSTFIQNKEHIIILRTEVTSTPTSFCIQRQSRNSVNVFRTFQYELAEWRIFLLPNHHVYLKYFWWDVLPDNVFERVNCMFRVVSL